jgi:hypothetical protein
LLKKFIFKNAVLGDFLIKMYKLPPVCGDVVLYTGRPGVVYDSLVINRSAAGGGRGAVIGSLPCFLLVTCEAYMTPIHKATHILIAIRIRVKSDVGPLGPLVWKLALHEHHVYTRT